ncbi:MAG: hypothetical protein JNL43_00290 [Flavobacteriales bacterium]|nr:hypothetical protein [Flavobacteriales bacterium]
MRATLLYSALTFPLVSNAQWAAPSVNTPVRQASGVEAATPLSAPGPDGSTYVCWFESDGSGYVLRTQRLDANGVAMWDPAGLLVSDQPQNSALFRYDLASDGAGNAIVAFQDERTGVLDVVACKVGPDGTLPWGDGISLPSPTGTGLAPNIGVLTDDRLVFAWTTDASPSTVALQVVAPDGTLSPTTAEYSAPGNINRPKIVPTSDGGFWLQYVEQTGNFLSPGTLKAIRISAASENGPVLSVSSKQVSGFYFPQPVPDGHDGFYVAINTGNVANANLTDVYIARLRDDGTTWSETGTAVEEGATTQRYTNTAAPALVSDEDGLMMAYSRTNLNQDQGGIAVQRLDTAGVRQLGTAGVEVLPLSTALPGPFANASVVDGIMCATMQGGFSANTLSAFRIGLDGSVVDPPGEIDVCTVSSGKDDPTLVPFRDGQAVAVWLDQRNGAGIYAQPIMIPTGSGITEETNTAMLLRGGVRPAVVFPSGTVGRSSLRIIGPDGRLIHEQVLAPQTEGASIQLPVTGMSTGTYALVLEQARGRTVQRMMVW